MVTTFWSTSIPEKLLMSTLTASLKRELSSRSPRLCLSAWRVTSWMPLEFSRRKVSSRRAVRSSYECWERTKATSCSSCIRSFTTLWLKPVRTWKSRSKTLLRSWRRSSTVRSRLRWAMVVHSLLKNKSTKSSWMQSTMNPCQRCILVGCHGFEAGSQKQTLQSTDKR